MSARPMPRSSSRLRIIEPSSSAVDRATVLKRQCSNSSAVAKRAEVRLGVADVDGENTAAIIYGMRRTDALHALTGCQTLPARRAERRPRARSSSSSGMRTKRRRETSGVRELEALGVRPRRPPSSRTLDVDRARAVARALDGAPKFALDGLAGVQAGPAGSSAVSTRTAGVKEIRLVRASRRRARSRRPKSSPEPRSRRGHAAGARCTACRCARRSPTFEPRPR